MKEKTGELGGLYAAFIEEVRQYKTGEACKKGCSFCCTHAGTIDITTLEGLAIQEAMTSLPSALHKTVARALRRDFRNREKGVIGPCPFLLKNSACMIYSARPFSCRRITSMDVCSRDNPPRLHRHVMDVAETTIKALQQLDTTGYSGHISFVLNLLEQTAFSQVYLSGDFRPKDIMEFGKSHRIIINRLVS
ncbi:MAG: YkgJ family cysteine cluster protein [Pseudomonadota bacterium]